MNTRITISHEFILRRLCFYSLIVFLGIGFSSCGRKTSQMASSDKVGYVDLGAIFEEYKKVESYDKEMEKVSKTKPGDAAG